jgi:regulatory protein
MSGKITDLTTQKRNQHRVNVFIDGDYAFSLDAAVASRLQPGQFLSEADIAALNDDDEFTRAYAKALRFLTTRPRSTQEVRDNLRRKAFPEPLIEQVLDRLLALGYVNDFEFARAWVRNRDEFSPRGARGLQHELRQKGVDSAIIDEVLAEFDAEDAALRAARQKFDYYSRQSDTVEAFRRKMGGYLTRRGFSYDSVRTVLDTLLEELSFDDDTVEE